MQRKTISQNKENFDPPTYGLDDSSIQNESLENEATIFDARTTMYDPRSSSAFQIGYEMDQKKFSQYQGKTRRCGRCIMYIGAIMVVLNFMGIVFEALVLLGI